MASRCTEGSPRRVSASSMTSSCTRAKVWRSSSAAPRSTAPRVVGVAAGADERPVEERGPEPLAAGEHERAERRQRRRAGRRRRGPTARSRRRAGAGPGPRSPRPRPRGWAGPEPASVGARSTGSDIARHLRGDGSETPGPGARRRDGGAEPVSPARSGAGRLVADTVGSWPMPSATPPLTDAEQAARSTSFGSVADHYERYRPGPPAAVVDWFLPEPVGLRRRPRCRAPARSPACSPTRRATSSRSSPTTGCGRCSRPRCPRRGRSPGAARRSRCPTARRRACSRRRRGTGWIRSRRSPRSTGCWRPAACFGAVWTGPDPDGPFMQQAQALARADAGPRSRRRGPRRVAHRGRRGRRDDRRPVGAAGRRPVRSRRGRDDTLGHRPERRRADRAARDAELGDPDARGRAAGRRVFATARRLLARAAGHRGDDHGRRRVPGGRVRVTQPRRDPAHRAPEACGRLRDARTDTIPRRPQEGR